MLNRIRLFFTLDKDDYLYIKSLGYCISVKILKHKTEEKTYTPKGYPCEYYWRTNFIEYITLLLKDSKQIILIKKFGDDYDKTLLSVR